MKTVHVQNALLQGDLDASESAAVRAHLAECGKCRALDAALRESQAWLREDSEPPFSPEERLQLRRDVMARIQPRRPTRNLRPLLLLAAALGLLWVGRRWVHQESVPSLPPPVQAQILPAANAPVPQPRPTHPRRVASPERPSVPDTTLARIELQTEDPNIRIIWLAPSSTPTTLPTETPN
jgi:anti-sigma factor RsiW